MTLAAVAAPMQLTLQGQAMGTGWSVKLWGTPTPPLPQLRRSVEAALDRVVAQMSHWEPGSVLGRYNRAAASTWHDLPAEFAQVLAAALALAERSGGAYDPTLGALTRLWGFGPDGPCEQAPSAAAVEAARSNSGWQRLRFEPAAAHRPARLLQPGGVELDLSSIAKGYAVDLVLERLQASGVRHALVEVGGELRALGHRPDGQRWQVAIKHPGTQAGPGLSVALGPMAVATSGDDFRSRIDADGRRLGHTLDPRTGRPLAPGLASVTVLHPSCMQADALATALTVLGPEAGPAMARRDAVAALFIARSAEGWRSHMTPRFESLLA